MLFNSVCEFGERGEPGTWGDDVVGGGKELYNAAVGLARLGEIVQNPLTALAPSVFPSRVPAPVAISDRELGGAAIVNAALAFVPSSIAARLRAPLSAGMRLPEGGVAAKGAARSVDELSQAAAAADRGGLTAAGRALQKHGGREGSAFPAAKGNPLSVNQQGQHAVDDILTSPGSTTVTRNHARFGQFTEVRAPDGRGVRYGADGKFIGFLEPNK